MNYPRMSNEELGKCEFPNLIAEIIESGYSTSTLADFMGIGAKRNGRYREEGDPEVWNEINGIVEMPASHAVGLSRYYGVDIGYLFSDNLAIISDKPQAYWRWYDENRRQEAEFQKREEIKAVEYELHSKPELLELMKVARTLNSEQVQSARRMLLELAKRDKSVR